LTTEESSSSHSNNGPEATLVGSEGITIPVGSLNQRQKSEYRAMVLRQLLDSYTFVSMYSDLLYFYDRKRGIYLADGHAESTIKRHAQLAMGMRNTTRYDVQELIASVKRCTQHGYPSDEDFWSTCPKDKVCLRNGVVNINTEQLLPFSPDYHFRSAVNVEFIPRGDSRLNGKNRIDRFLHEIYENNEEQKNVDGAKEMFGYCLYPDYPLHKAWIEYGSGRNGRSVMLRLLEHILGQGNCSHLRLREFSDRFSTHVLYGKLANIFADLTDDEAKDTGLFKSATGQDWIDAEIKFVQGKVRFLNYAKVVISCNQIPKVTKDDTIGYWSRWIIVHHKRYFKPEERDPYLIDKLKDSLEVSSFFLDMLEALRRVLKTVRFSNERPLEETRETYIQFSDPVKAFADINVVSNLEEAVPKILVREKYREFCKTFNLIPFSDIAFSKALRDIQAFSDVQRTIGNHVGVTCYGGIMLRDIERCPVCLKPVFPKFEESFVNPENKRIHKACYKGLGKHM